MQCSHLTHWTLTKQDIRVHPGNPPTGMSSNEGGRHGQGVPKREEQELSLAMPSCAESTAPWAKCPTSSPRGKLQQRDNACRPQPGGSNFFLNQLCDPIGFWAPGFLGHSCTQLQKYVRPPLHTHIVVIIHVDTKTAHLILQDFPLNLKNRVKVTCFKQNQFDEMLKARENVPFIMICDRLFK